MKVAMVEAVLKSSMQGSDAAEVTNVHEAGARKVGDVIREGEMLSKVTPRLRTGASEVKVRDEELVVRYIEESWIFLIWSGRPRMMNSVLEGLRHRRLDDIH